MSQSDLSSLVPPMQEGPEPIPDTEDIFKQLSETSFEIDNFLNEFNTSEIKVKHLYYQTVLFIILFYYFSKKKTITIYQIQIMSILHIVQLVTKRGRKLLLKCVLSSSQSPLQIHCWRRNWRNLVGRCSNNSYQVRHRVIDHSWRHLYLK